MPNQKYTSEQVQKLPRSFLLNLINEAKAYLKTSQTMIDICDEYGVSVDYVDLIPTRFEKLDVSAKTNHGIVLLNFKLLEDGSFYGDYGYLVHEYSHFFQQCLNAKPTKGTSGEGYLDNKFEIEGFQNQIKYMDEEFGKEEAEKYVDKLVDYHDLKGNKKEDKKDELLDLVD
jgi:hypothetical protein